MRPHLKLNHIEIINILVPSCCTVPKATSGTVQVDEMLFTFYQNLVYFSSAELLTDPVI